MNEITFNDLIDLVAEYNQEEVGMVTKAYEYAKLKHQGQYRQSGEEYIIHPLNVCYILATMHADKDTLCAGLLHDVLEDTDSTYDEIEELFNSTIASLVDGVTKISKLNFSTIQEENATNTRKIINGISQDVRIIIIKLADRLHNMRTLSFKSVYKQKENAIETLELYAPLAYSLGAYRIKSELEDLSLQYIEPEKYNSICNRMMTLKEFNQAGLNEMLKKIHTILSSNDIPNSIKIRTKNVYGVYKALQNGEHMTDIHDLFALKIMVNEIDDCYLALRRIHELYHPAPNRIKDFICNPKTNMYQSLHTTVFGPNDRLVQTQIRTFEMDKVASFGLTTYWDINKGDARIVMQQNIRDKFQVFRPLGDINNMFDNNQEYVTQAKKELLSERVYVFNMKDGLTIDLPKGSTIIDYACRVMPKLVRYLFAARVNGQDVSLDYVLQNKDQIKLIVNEKTIANIQELKGKAYTLYAKKIFSEE